MRPIRDPLDESHPDYPVLASLRDAIAGKAGGLANLQVKFRGVVRDAIDFVLDPVRTARTKVRDLDNVEKTFIGLKLEHFVRDMLDVPKGLRDLRIGDLDVDIKNTVGQNWSIPVETYRASEPCLLMAIDDDNFTCSLGLIIAKPEYLHGGAGNRDSKKGVSSEGFKNILWLVHNEPFPASRFMGLDMARFRELRKIKGGNARVVLFLRENLRRIIHRDVMMALLFDQYDPMKRLRANGGAPDILKNERISLLIGTFRSDRMIAESFGFNDLKPDEILSIDARSDQEWNLAKNAGRFLFVRSSLTKSM
jgi:hypothetical protein